MGTQHVFELAIVNERSVFELVRFDCILNFILRSKNSTVCLLVTTTEEPTTTTTAGKLP